GQAVQHLAHEVGLNSTSRQAGEGFGFHSDGESPDMHDAIAEMKTVATSPWQAAFVGDVAGEIGGIDLSLKSDKIVMAERRNELVVIGQGRKNFRRRKRNVDEKPNLIVMAAIPQRLRQWN